MVISWDLNCELLGLNDVFYGIYLWFNGIEEGIVFDLRKFMAKLVNATPTAVGFMLFQGEWIWGMNMGFMDFSQQTMMDDGYRIWICEKQP